MDGWFASQVWRCDCGTLMSCESGNPQSVSRRLARQRPSASVFLATTDDIRDATAQWSLNLRQIAIVEAEMDTDLKRGWIGSRSGPARGRAVSNVPPPQHLYLSAPPVAAGGELQWTAPHYKNSSLRFAAPQPRWPKLSKGSHRLRLN
jgi:hypothetical protein